MTPDELEVGIEAHLHAEGKGDPDGGLNGERSRARRPSRDRCRLDLDHELRIGEAGDADERSRRSGSPKPGMQDAKLREEGIHVGREDVEPNNVRKGHSRTIEDGLEVVERKPELRSQVAGELWFPLRIDAVWPAQ